MRLQRLAIHVTAFVFLLISVEVVRAAAFQMSHAIFRRTYNVKLQASIRGQG